MENNILLLGEVILIIGLSLFLITSIIFLIMLGFFTRKKKTDENAELLSAEKETLVTEPTENKTNIKVENGEYFLQNKLFELITFVDKFLLDDIELLKKSYKEFLSENDLSIIKNHINTLRNNDIISEEDLKEISNNTNNFADDKKLIDELSKIELKEISDRTNKFKGKYGEILLLEELLKLNIDYKKILMNVEIAKGDNQEATEIDLLLIHSTGIYVFESKYCRNGLIWGYRQNKKWTVALNKKINWSIANPLQQNDYHIQQLSKLLNIDNENFISYVVFSGNCKFGKIFPRNEQYEKVIYFNTLSRYMQQDIGCHNPIFTNEEIEEIYNNICNHNRTINQSNNEYSTT